MTDVRNLHFTPSFQLDSSSLAEMRFFRTLPAVSPDMLRNSATLFTLPFQQHTTANTQNMSNRPLLPPLHALCNSNMEQPHMLSPSLANASTSSSSSLPANRKMTVSTDMDRTYEKYCNSTSPVEQSRCLASPSPSCMNSPRLEYFELLNKAPETSAETAAQNDAALSRTSSTATVDHKQHVFTGVSRSGFTGRWRSQLSRKGKTIHLGTFPTAEDAAKAWDRAAVAERGGEAVTNFPIDDYLNEDGSIKPESDEEAAKKFEAKVQKEFRGVYNSGTYGRWKARIVVHGKKLHLGTFATAAEAARAWDRKAIFYRGADTQTNFDISEYADEVQQASEGEHGEERVISSDVSRATTPSSAGKRQRGDDTDGDDVERVGKLRCLASLSSLASISICPPLSSSASSLYVHATHATVLPPLKNMISLLSLCDAAVEMQ